ncbi:hypothetical protein WJX75_009725 [Coccomyxa subellipsoidea]|uniref:Uncharacterized protein n=1 Tax=Coccomyxa subellipsoidea TaxID=248742 RepID=A0ABR2YH06_9CHLO
MCGPAGTMFCLGMSIFGSIFMGAMALMLKNEYQYLGEWYDTSEPDHPSYQEQRAAAMHNCWTVAAIYGGIAVLCAGGTCYHSFKAKRS